MREIDPICGHKAILIERVNGRQLTPEEFEAAFFAAGIGRWALGIGGDGVEISRKDTKNTKSVIISNWIDYLGLKPIAERLMPLIASCRECGALDLRSPVGVVHGDFAPWNTIRVNESGVKSKALGVKQGENLKPNRLKHKIGNSQRLCMVDWEFSRADTPFIFDFAYAAWCYSELLGRTVSCVDSKLWSQLVALGALWEELRVMSSVDS